MARKIKCPGFLCGSADVEYLGGNQRTSINLNLLHPFTLVNTKPIVKINVWYNRVVL